ncbi:MAG: serine--tRNA ligase [Alphaproteobacteria bacterium]|nr:serine--tRNA ligase [Alphaproteobacteria bacterium]
MLDIKFIKENPEVVKNACEVKGFACDIDRLLELEIIVRNNDTKIQELQAEKNSLSAKIKSATNEERPAIIEASKKAGEEIKKIEEELTPLKNELKDLILSVPQIPHKDMPIGKTDEDNVVLRTEGEIPELDFEPLSHFDLCEKNDWADFQRVSNVCGSRSILCLKGRLARLEFALYNYMQDKMEEAGFTQLNLPALIKKEAIFDAGHFPGSDMSVMDNDVFALGNDNRSLAGTSEIAINSLHAGEVIDESKLPLMYTAYSTCFRREAGAAGKDTRGFVRGNQFNKQEMYVFCKNDPKESQKMFELMFGLFESFVSEMEMPYHVLEACSGDVGFNKVKMHDLEAWSPAQNRYIELGSCSIIHDFQARRTKTRYKNQETGKIEYCHTLNNTCLATPRFLALFLENHQTAEGKVKLPEKLRPYMGGKEYL